MQSIRSDTAFQAQGRDFAHAVFDFVQALQPAGGTTSLSTSQLRTLIMNSLGDVNQDIAAQRVQNPALTFEIEMVYFQRSLLQHVANAMGCMVPTQRPPVAAASLHQATQQTARRLAESAQSIRAMQSQAYTIQQSRSCSNSTGSTEETQDDSLVHRTPQSLNSIMSSRMKDCQTQQQGRGGLHRTQDDVDTTQQHIHVVCNDTDTEATTFRAVRPIHSSDASQQRQQQQQQSSTFDQDMPYLPHVHISPVRVKAQVWPSPVFGLHEEVEPEAATSPASPRTTRSRSRAAAAAAVSHKPAPKTRR